MSKRPIINWEDWLASPPGQYMLQWEQAQYDRTVVDIFGYHAVQLGLPHIDTLRENRMPFSALALAPGNGPHGPRAQADARQLLCRFDELPFETQSIDLVTLPHILEFSEDPHEVLREVSRVLMPEGRVVVTCFNPMSLWGARQGLKRFGADPFLPNDSQSIGFVRIKDWLKLLGFDIIRGRFGCYCPPYHTERWLQRTAFMEKAGDRWWPIFGSVYMISAVKRVRNIRLVGPAWKSPKAALSPVAAPVATPTGTHGKAPGDEH